MKTFTEFQESIASLALKKGASKILPQLMIGAGLTGTLFQAARKAKKARKSYTKREKNVTSSKPSEEEMLQQVRKKQAEINADLGNEELDDYMNTPTDIDKFVTNKKINKNILKKINKPENQFEDAIVNSLGGGNIAGTSEAGDDPPVKKRKNKTYAYGGIGSRKMWMKNKYT